MSIEIRLLGASLYHIQTGGLCARGCGQPATTPVSWLAYHIGDYCCAGCARRLNSIRPRLTWTGPRPRQLKGD